MTPRVERVSAGLGACGVIGLTCLACGFARLGVTPAMFCAGAAPTWLFLCAALWRAGRSSPTAPDPRAAAALTLPTWVTIGRGFLISVVAGFAWPPLPVGAGRWIPGVVYTLAVLGDRLDGALARRTQRITPLGAALDVTTDAVGLLVAPLVAVRWGRLPPWYLLMAVAHPAFRVALALRARRRLPVFPERLRPYAQARFFAGVQMGVVATALWPVLPRVVLWPAATLAMTPTLALFVREWRLVTGRSAPLHEPAREGLHA
jgi:CDP-diacylglycerol--glycerol-3-phosphate 3-phosphatidyltransferase